MQKGATLPRAGSSSFRRSMGRLLRCVRVSCAERVRAGAGGGGGRRLFMRCDAIRCDAMRCDAIGVRIGGRGIWNDLTRASLDPPPPTLPNTQTAHSMGRRIGARAPPLQSPRRSARDGQPLQQRRRAPCDRSRARDLAQKRDRLRGGCGRCCTLQPRFFSCLAKRDQRLAARDQRQLLAMDALLGCQRLGSSRRHREVDSWWRRGGSLSWGGCMAETLSCVAGGGREKIVKREKLQYSTRGENVRVIARPGPVFARNIPRAPSLGQQRSELLRHAVKTHIALDGKRVEIVDVGIKLVCRVAQRREEGREFRVAVHLSCAGRNAATGVRAWLRVLWLCSAVLSPALPCSALPWSEKGVCSRGSSKLDSHRILVNPSLDEGPGALLGAPGHVPLQHTNLNDSFVSG